MLLLCLRPRGVRCQLSSFIQITRKATITCSLREVQNAVTIHLTAIHLHRRAKGADAAKRRFLLRKAQEVLQMNKLPPVVSWDLAQPWRFIGPLTGRVISHITLQTSPEGQGQLHVFKILHKSSDLESEARREKTKAVLWLAPSQS